MNAHLRELVDRVKGLTRDARGNRRHDGPMLIGEFIEGLEEARAELDELRRAEAAALRSGELVPASAALREASPAVLKAMLVFYRKLMDLEMGEDCRRATAESMRAVETLLDHKLAAGSPGRCHCATLPHRHDCPAIVEPRKS